MERAFVVFVALASISPAAEHLDLEPLDFRPLDSLCDSAQPSRECAALANKLGNEKSAARQYSEAETLFTRAISLGSAAEPSEDLAKAYQNLGAVYQAEGRYSDAASIYESVIQLREFLTGPSDISLLPALNELGVVYLEKGDYERAERTSRRAISIARIYQTEQTTYGADAMNNLALALLQQGRLSEAEDLYRRALAVYRRTSDPGSEVTVLNSLGRVLMERGQHKEARNCFNELSKRPNSSLARRIRRSRTASAIWRS
jgi:tetratricopeptide (TPR) repeat protein